MKPNATGPAETPQIVRIALWVNLLLVAIALVAPRMMAGESGKEGGSTAALLFVIPMALIPPIGAAAAISAFVLARREERSVRWTAFLPLLVFCSESWAR
jgi:hypothetical protein